MMKLEEVKVKNFKSLIDTHIKTFGDTNMFYGFNNSGKSNIFKFLQLVFSKKKEIVIVEVEESESKKSTSRLENEVDFWKGYIYDEPFIYSNNDRTVPIEFSASFSISNSSIPNSEILAEHKYINLKDKDSKLILRGTINSINSKDSQMNLVSVDLNGKNFYKLEDEVLYFFEGVADIEDTIGEDLLNIFNNCVEYIDTERNFSREIFGNNVTKLNNKDFKNWLFELNMNAEKNDAFNGLASFLASFDFSDEAKEKLNSNINSFPFRDFTDIGFTRLGNELEVMLKNQNNRLPLSSFGTGIQQFFYILTRIFMNDSRIVIIEEIELNLSPVYQKELMKFVKSVMGDKYDQLLFSSHSPFFTLEKSDLVDIVEHVQIGNSVLNKGTTVEPHETWEGAEGTSFFSLLYS